MITKKIVIIGGKEFMYRASDKGVMLERDGELYSEAYDPLPLAYERSYTETDEPIVKEEETEGGEDGGNDETRRYAEAVE